MRRGTVLVGHGGIRIMEIAALGPRAAGAQRRRPGPKAIAPGLAAHARAEMADRADQINRASDGARESQLETHCWQSDYSAQQRLAASFSSLVAGFAVARKDRAATGDEVVLSFGLNFGFDSCRADESDHHHYPSNNECQ